MDARRSASITPIATLLPSVEQPTDVAHTAERIVKMEPVDVLGRRLTLCSSGTACQGLLNSSHTVHHGCMPYAKPGNDRCVECDGHNQATAGVTAIQLPHAAAALDPDAMKEQMARREELQRGNYQRKEAERLRKAENLLIYIYIFSYARGARHNIKYTQPIQD